MCDSGRALAHEEEEGAPLLGGRHSAGDGLVVVVRYVICMYYAVREIIILPLIKHALHEHNFSPSSFQFLAPHATL